MGDITTLRNGLQYKVLKNGDGEFHPWPFTPVEIHYTSWLTNGTQLQSTWEETGKTLPIIPYHQIAGMREALTRMVEGDVWKLWIPCDLGYGDDPYIGFTSKDGTFLKIPEGSTLIYKVELVAIHEKYVLQPGQESTLRRKGQIGLLRIDRDPNEQKAFRCIEDYIIPPPPIPKQGVHHIAAPGQWYDPADDGWYSDMASRGKKNGQYRGVMERSGQRDSMTEDLQGGGDQGGTSSIFDDFNTQNEGNNFLL